MKLSIYINFRFFLALLLLSCMLAQQVTAAQQKPINAKQEMEFNAYNAAHWQTSVTTYKGSIYLVWVDKSLRTMIAKKAPNGKITTNVILQKSKKGKNHNLPSVGIDKDGYIHVAYNMHHSQYKNGDRGWQYKVSNKPEDIRSFTFVGNTKRTIPGQMITYPSFTRDNNNELYVTFRHRTHREGKFGFNGSQGIGIAKYNSNSKLWSMLGGTNYKHGVKTFFWSNSSQDAKSAASGHKTAGYQGYRAKILFDKKNRMHVSWDVFIAPGKEASHIMYAYSDNGGKTFKKANGSTINSMPITPQNGDIVERAPRGIYDTRTYVAVTKDGRPIVSFEDRSNKGKPYYKVWNGKNWGNKKVLPSAASPATLTVDSDGVLITMGNGKLSRSRNNGEKLGEL